MDEDNPLVQILKQINELSGAALEALLSGSAEGGAPAPAEGGGEAPVPAPPAEGQ